MKKAAIALAVVILLAGCQRAKREVSSPSGSNAEPTAAPERTFEGAGVVERVDPEHLVVVIKHKNIPGFMPAMTMPYHVERAEMLAGLRPGDRVKFTVGQGPEGIRILRIQKTH